MGNRLIQALVLVILVVTTAGCKKPVAPGRIVFLGDSLTAGYGLEASEAYPALIHIEQMESINLGVSGDEVSQGVARLKDYFAKGNEASLVVIALGANDILRGNSPQVIESGLREAIGECKSRDIPVLLCGVNIPLKFGGAEVFKRVAKSEGVPLMGDILDDVLGKSKLMQADDAHPSAAGQAVMAANVEQALRAKFRFP
jgi:acyl-CoA thioesterase I